MNRDLVINILLILAGIVLAIALFGAGVLWKSRAPTKTSGLVKPQASETAKNDCTWITGNPEVNCCYQATTLKTQILFDRGYTVGALASRT